MALERLVQRILSDARHYADGLVNEAKFRRLETLERAEEEAEQRYTEILEAGRRAAEEEKQQRITTAVLAARREILMEKQRAIRQVLARAVDSIVSLPRDRYIELLVKQIAKLGRDVQGELVLSAADRERIGEDLVRKANIAIRENGGSGEVALSSETRDISGGFILVISNVEINSSLDAQIEANREEIEEAIVEVLFSNLTWSSSFH